MSTENEELNEIEEQESDASTKDDINFFDLPDEEVMSMPDPDDTPPEDVDEDDPNEAEDDTVSEEDTDEDALEEDDDTSLELDENDSDDSEQESDNDEIVEDESESESDEDDSKDDLDEDKDEEPSDKDDKGKVDYEAKYKEIMAPFKAAGKEISLNNVDEAKRLMQMGVDYSRKMHALKPNLRYLKTLEKADLLDDTKLNTLIDLHNKKPEAIMKLIQDSGLDPLEMDLDKALDYKPGNHSISEADSNLDDVIERIQNTPSYTRTVDIVKNQMDQVSKDALYQNPGLIEMLNNQIGNGVYDRIMGEVEKRRTLGQLQGVVDLQAYEIVGQELYPINANQQQQGNVDGNGSDSSNLKPDENKQVNKKQVQRKKKAAKAVAKKPKAKAPQNPKSVLEMSDEAFEKEVGPEFNF